MPFHVTSQLVMTIKESDTTTEANTYSTYSAVRSICSSFMDSSRLLIGSSINLFSLGYATTLSQSTCTGSITSG